MSSTSRAKAPWSISIRCSRRRCCSASIGPASPRVMNGVMDPMVLTEQRAVEVAVGSATFWNARVGSVSRSAVLVVNDAVYGTNAAPLVSVRAKSVAERISEEEAVSPDRDAPAPVPRRGRHTGVVAYGLAEDSPPRDEALAQELGIANGPVVGFIGSFYDYEGLDDLIDAMPALLAREPAARLLLVGSYGGFDLYFAMLQQLVATLRGTWIVHVAHPVDVRIRRLQNAFAPCFA